MCKRLFLLTLLISLLTGVSSSADPVGIFEDTVNVGDDPGIGSTLYDADADSYLITGSGHDIWDAADDFHYAYNTVDGDVRLSADFEWVARGGNDWAKYGVMLRESTDAGSVFRFMSDRGLNDYARAQGRSSTDAGAYELGGDWNSGAQALAIQRVTVEGMTVLEGLADFGSGWESRFIELVLNGNLEGEILAGVAVCSHDNTWMVQAQVWNVLYEENPSLVGELSFPTVPASADLGVCPTDTPGFSIRALAPLVTDGWGTDAMNELLDTGMYKGLPAMPGSEGTRIDEFVNLYDTGGRGSFNEGNGYPDMTFPGIDPLESPAAEPAAGDDDNNFAAEMLGCIQLTAGIHVFAASHDDNVFINIGGVEVVSREGWDGGNVTVFPPFMVEADGCYDLQVRYMEGGGGAYLELHEVLSDGTHVLLNDVANGGPAVFAP